MDIALTLQPHAITVYRWWRTAALAQGVLSALEAGASGFRLGLRYRNLNLAATVSDRQVNSMVHWAPFSMWAASTVPPMQLPVFLTMYLAASSSQALQGAIFAAAGLYAGAISGFAHGTVHTMLQTLKILGGATQIVAAGASGVLKIFGAIIAAFVR